MSFLVPALRFLKSQHQASLRRVSEEVKVGVFEQLRKRRLLKFSIRTLRVGGGGGTWTVVRADRQSGSWRPNGSFPFNRGFRSWGVDERSLSVVGFSQGPLSPSAVSIFSLALDRDLVFAHSKAPSFSEFGVCSLSLLSFPLPSSLSLSLPPSPAPSLPLVHLCYRLLFGWFCVDGNFTVLLFKACDGCNPAAKVWGLNLWASGG